MDDADQLPGAGAGQERAGELERPYPSYEFRQLFASEQEILTGQKPLLDPAVFKDKIVFIGLTASGLLDVFGTPMSTSRTARCPASSSTPAWPTASWRTGSSGRRPSRSRIGAILIAALSIGMLAAFLPFTTAAIASLAILGGVDLVHGRARSSGGLWLNLVQPLAVGGLALFFGTAYQYFVEGKGEAESREAVRPIRLDATSTRSSWTTPTRPSWAASGAR